MGGYFVYGWFCYFFFSCLVLVNSVVMVLFVGGVFCLCGVLCFWCGWLLLVGCLLCWFLIFLLGVLFMCMDRLIWLCGMFIFMILILMMLLVLIILYGFLMNFLDSVEMCIRLFWWMLMLMNVLKLVMLVIMFFRIMFGLRFLRFLMFFWNFVVLNFGCGLWLGLLSFLRMLVMVGRLKVLLVNFFGLRCLRNVELLISEWMLCLVLVVMCCISG